MYVISVEATDSWSRRESQLSPSHSSMTITIFQPHSARSAERCWRKRRSGDCEFSARSLPMEVDAATFANQVQESQHGDDLRADDAAFLSHVDAVLHGKPVGRERRCPCGADISHRFRTARYCEACADSRHKESAALSTARWYRGEKRIKKCEWPKCNVDISHKRGFARYCDDHQRIYRRQRDHEYYEARRAA